MYDIMLMNLGIKPRHYNPLVDPPPPDPTKPTRTLRQRAAVTATLRKIAASRTVERREDAARIVEFIKERDGVTVNQITDHFMWSDDKSRKLLHMLKAEKRVFSAKVAGEHAAIWKVIHENETGV